LKVDYFTIKEHKFCKFETVIRPGSQYIVSVALQPEVIPFQGARHWIRIFFPIPASASASCPLKNI